VKPTILIAATSRWFPAARLAMALARAGCTVTAVCPSGHPLRKVSVVRDARIYNGLMPLSSFRDAIAAIQPDVVIPGDDLATRHLHRLHERERQSGKAGGMVCAVIERSLGAPESFPVVYARTPFMKMAMDQGIRVPATGVLGGIEDLREWTSKRSFPIVLKANGTSGGDGVRIVYTAEEAEKSYRDLQAPPLLARALKRALIDQDKTLVWPSLMRRRFVVNAQAFIAGHETTSTVACWKGKVLAGLHFEVVNKRYASGPATVVRLIENGEMASAVEKMVQGSNLSGLHGFDFMLEEATGYAYLIEINPRTTQAGHLALGSGRDLPAALTAALSNSPLQAAPKVTEKDTITLFPQEWMRDPASDFLRSGYHDVPWEEPELLKACIRHGQKQKQKSASSRKVKLENYSVASRAAASRTA
jgi:hypothetical protein